MHIPRTGMTAILSNPATRADTLTGSMATLTRR